MFIEYNINPVANRTEDCGIRAVAVALGLTWEQAFDLLAYNARAMGDVMHSNAVIGSALRQNGFNKALIPNQCPDCYTIADFAIDNPKGDFVVGTGSHVVAVVDGNIIDTFNSKDLVPVWYWYRKEG
jgi:hypothetical protein